MRIHVMHWGDNRFLFALERILSRLAGWLVGCLNAGTCGMWQCVAQRLWRVSFENMPAIMYYSMGTWIFNMNRLYYVLLGVSVFVRLWCDRPGHFKSDLAENPVYTYSARGKNQFQLLHKHGFARNVQAMLSSKCCVYAFNPDKHGICCYEYGEWPWSSCRKTHTTQTKDNKRIYMQTKIEREYSIESRTSYTYIIRRMNDKNVHKYSEPVTGHAIWAWGREGEGEGDSDTVCVLCVYECGRQFKWKRVHRRIEADATNSRPFNSILMQ